MPTKVRIDGTDWQPARESARQSVRPHRNLAKNPQRKAKRQRKTDHEHKSNIRIHGVNPRLVDIRVIPRPSRHARPNRDLYLWNVDASSGHKQCDAASAGLADRAVTAWHDIHVTVRALPMPMHPDKLFRPATGRASRHDMRRLTRSRGLMRPVPAIHRITHLGPSLSFSLCRAATVPSWNVPNQASSGKSTLP